jgi:hypothetical protein
MGLALLAHASMPLKYWDEDFLAATFLINHTLTKLLSYDTPMHKLLARHQTTLVSVFSGVYVGQICDLTIPISSGFDLFVVSF